MGKQTKSIFLFLSIIILSFTFIGCGGAGGSGATETSDEEVSKVYSFDNADESLKIENYRPYEISFQLTQGGVAQSSKEVVMKTFPSQYGYITAQNITTDENGNGSFTYNPPSEDQNGSYTIEYSYLTDENSSITQKVTLDFQDYKIDNNGQATSLSLVYMQTINEEGSGKIINRYRVHAVNKKSNQPIVGIPVTMSLINNAKIKPLDKNDTGKIENNTSITFSDTNTSINYSTITQDDNLIILPTENRLDASYLGGWIVDKVSSDKLTLTLSESDVNISTTDALKYVIGNEVRLVGDKVAVADVANVNNDTTTDENGYIIFDVTFDPKLAGHTVTLEAHGDIDGQRVGVSQIAILRFEDINAKPYIIDNQDDIDKTITLIALINSTETLSKIKLDKNSFHAVSSGNNVCSIKESSFTNDSIETTEDGEIILTVETTQAKEDNKSVVTTCTVSWDGGITSINREY